MAQKQEEGVWKIYASPLEGGREFLLIEVRSEVIQDIKLPLPEYPVKLRHEFIPDKKQNGGGFHATTM